MSKRLAALLFGLSLAGAASAADTFVAGTHWFPVEPPQPTTTGDKVEVVEVFSYACPACNFFEPTMRKLEAALPANAALVHLPASFRPDENWPVFQRAYYAAQALGIVDRSHKAMFGAVYLTLVCLLPEVMRSKLGASFYFGGTSLLIVVVVVMDFIAQIQAHLMSHQYESLLKKANLKGGSRGGLAPRG